jgi:hypothetical protein
MIRPYWPWRKPTLTVNSDTDVVAVIFPPVAIGDIWGIEYSAFSSKSQVLSNQQPDAVNNETPTETSVGTHIYVPKSRQEDIGSIIRYNIPQWVHQVYEWLPKDMNPDDENAKINTEDTTKYGKLQEILAVATYWSEKRRASSCIIVTPYTTKDSNGAQLNVGERLELKSADNVLLSGHVSEVYFGVKIGERAETRITLTHVIRGNKMDAPAWNPAYEDEGGGDIGASGGGSGASNTGQVGVT